MQGHLEPGVFPGVPHGRDLGGGGHAVLQAQTAFHPGNLRPIDTAADLDQVDFFYFMLRVRQAKSEVAVIGQQQSPLGRQVEAADGKQPTEAFRHQIQNSGSALRIAGCGDVSRRLVQQQTDLAFHRRQRSTVDADAVLLRIGALAQRSGPAVDAHPAGLNDGFRFSPRGDAGLGKDLLQSLLHGDCQKNIAFNDITKDGFCDEIADSEAEKTPTSGARVIRSLRSLRKTRRNRGPAGRGPPPRPPGPDR